MTDETFLAQHRATLVRDQDGWLLRYPIQNRSLYEEKRFNSPIEATIPLVGETREDSLQIAELLDILERFMDVLSCIDQCFIADSMLEQLPASSWVGKTKVGGIDLNKPRMRWVVEAVIALSPSADGFTASELARQVRVFSDQRQSEYGARRAAYDLKKLRAKKIVQRIGQTRRYESTSRGTEGDSSRWWFSQTKRSSPC